MPLKGSVALSTAMACITGMEPGYRHPVALAGGAKPCKAIYNENDGRNPRAIPTDTGGSAPPERSPGAAYIFTRAVTPKVRGLPG